MSFGSHDYEPNTGLLSIALSQFVPLFATHVIQRRIRAGDSSHTRTTTLPRVSPLRELGVHREESGRETHGGRDVPRRDLGAVRFLMSGKRDGEKRAVFSVFHISPLTVRRSGIACAHFTLE